MNQVGCSDTADSASTDCMYGDPSDVSGAVKIFQEAKEFWNVASFLTDLKPKEKRQPTSRIHSQDLDVEDDWNPDNYDPCTQVLDAALQMCASQCPGSTTPEEIIEPQSYEPRKGISSSKRKRDGDQQQQVNMAALHQVTGKNRDGSLTLHEYLEYANYSAGYRLTTPTTVKPFIKYFYSFDADGDGKVSYDESERETQNKTWTWSPLTYRKNAH